MTRLILVCVVAVVSGFIGYAIVQAPQRLMLLAFVGVALTWFLVTVQRPIYNVYLFVMLWPFGVGMARLPGIFLKPGEALLAGLFLISILGALARRQRLSPLSVVDGAFLIFFAGRSLLPLLVFQAAGGGSFTFYEFRILFGVAKYYLIYRLVLDSLRTEEEAIKCLRLMLGTSLVVAAVGVLQALRVPEVEQFLSTYFPSPWQEGAIGYAGRVTSVFGGDWNGAGSYFGLQAAVALALHSMCTLDRWRRVAVLALVANLTLMLLTGSVGSIFGTMSALIVLQRLNRPFPRGIPLWKLLLIGLVGVLVSIMAFQPIVLGRFDRLFSLSESPGILPANLVGRLAYWEKVVLPAVSRSPLVGTGPYIVTAFAPSESYYIMLLARGGALGLLAFVVYTTLIVVSIRRVLSTPARRWGSLGLATFVGVAVASLGGDHFEYPQTAGYLWLLLALAVRTGSFAHDSEHARKGRG